MQPATPYPVRTIQPAPAKPKNMIGVIVGYVILGMFICILVVAAAGLGYWGYTLNNNLAATQQQLATLQGQYSTLKSDDAKLAADLEKTKTDLKKTQGDLATAQADLDQAKNQTSSLQAKIDKASKYLTVLVGFWGDTVSNSETKIKATNDSLVLSKYQTFAASNLNKDFYAFFDAIVSAIVNSLK